MEELNQKGYISPTGIKGDVFGNYEEMVIGQTTLRNLVKAGVSMEIADKVDFPFEYYQPPQTPKSVKPDNIYLHRPNGELYPVATYEHKDTGKFSTDKDRRYAAEQGLFAASAAGVKIAVITDGTKYLYVDVRRSLERQELAWFDEKRDFQPAVLEFLHAGSKVQTKDPKPLAETVWQAIWHATKEEPKDCLLTFVEIFVLKFLSDNLTKNDLPKSCSFYEMICGDAEFNERHGKTQVEYYYETVRPHIKKLFPDNVQGCDKKVKDLFGLEEIVSRTSVINGFSLMRDSRTSVPSHNRTFVSILNSFNDFGSLENIDPEFKFRLYETFLKKSTRQAKLGQFFTPRNVVRSIVKMARLSELDDDAVVLDPAAGVGGFILEPYLFEDALQDTITFVKGKAARRVKTVGVDVDVNTHILAKANLLIHLAEHIRDPKTTIKAVNKLMADTFVLMNNNETLGALEQPPRNSVDVIMTNPPYVTQGSKIYGDEIARVDGLRNGVELNAYYNRTGLGLESLFLRYISGALKPGGRAFVIVPLGMLTRTQNTLKEKVLQECDLIASIMLPTNTFYNTAQKTYLLVLERRHTEDDPRPNVFCGVASSIGEVLDNRRLPSLDNDLDDIATAFVEWSDDNRELADKSNRIKLVDHDEFGANEPWDVDRFWSEEEKVDLGLKALPITRDEYVEKACQDLESVIGELNAAKDLLDKLEDVQYW